MAYEESFDVMLCVQGSSFQVHKFALIAGSPIFAGMFKDDVSGCASFVDIDDCDADTFVTFLEYLYSGSTEENITFEVASKLYYTALKYEVQGLKQSCLQSLHKNMTVVNVIQAAVLAHKYKESKLMTSVKNFFHANLCTIVSTPEWGTFLEKNFDLSIDLVFQSFKPSTRHATSPQNIGMSTEDITFKEAWKSYHIALKYKMQDLKQSSLQSMSKNITVRNITEAAILAHKYQESKLMTSVKNFFCRNSSDIISKPQWLSFQKNFFDLSIDLMLHSLPSNRDIISLQNIGKPVEDNSSKDNLQRLSRSCLQGLCHTLTMDNILDAATLAHKCNDSYLMNCVQNFFRNNLNDILCMPQWFSFQEKNLDLAVDLALNLKSTVSVPSAQPSSSRQNRNQSVSSRSSSRPNFRQAVNSQQRFDRPVNSQPNFQQVASSWSNFHRVSG